MRLKDFFYLQKNDRQALIAVLAIMMVCMAIFVLIDQKDNNGKDDTASNNDSIAIAHATKENPVYYNEDGITHEVFPFDPNTADSAELAKLGFAPWQIKSIYHYRAKGGVYSRPSDVARIYGMTKRRYEALRPFIRIADDFKPASDFYGNEPRYAHRPNRSYNNYYNNEGNNTNTNPESKENRIYSYPHKLKAGEHIAVNTADTTDLQKIPGIGSGYARAIVRYRDQLGGFAQAQQLLEIEGLPESALAFVTIDHKDIHKMNLNTMTLSQLKRHPYINYYQAKAICDYRRLKGPLKSLKELELLKEFPPAEIERLQPYVSF